MKEKERNSLKMRILLEANMPLLEMRKKVRFNFWHWWIASAKSVIIIRVPHFESPEFLLWKLSYLANARFPMAPLCTTGVRVEKKALKEQNSDEFSSKINRHFFSRAMDEQMNKKHYIRSDVAHLGEMKNSGIHKITKQIWSSQRYTTRNWTKLARNKRDERAMMSLIWINIYYVQNMRILK